MVLPCPVVLNRGIFFATIHLRQVMEQEGWHYELENKDEPLTYKGVVFNEMKGVYSSPDSLHGRTCQQVNPRICHSTRQPLLLAVNTHIREVGMSLVSSHQWPVSSGSFLVKYRPTRVQRLSGRPSVIHTCMQTLTRKYLGMKVLRSFSRAFFSPPTGSFCPERACQDPFEPGMVVVTNLC